MELRCFMVQPSDASVRGSYVEVSPASSNGHPTNIRALGRHSPELYWQLGNDHRYSRKMFSVALEALSEDELSANCVHPQMAQRLVLKCLGKNPVMVSQRSLGACPGKRDGEGCIVLHRNESTTLRVGDGVRITERLWLQVVVARVCVSSVIGEPVVALPQGEGEEGDTLRLPATGVFWPRSQDFSMVPVVHVGQPWLKLPSSVRSVLVNSVWQCQLAANSSTSVALVVSSAAVPSAATSPSGGCTPGFVSHEVNVRIEEEEAAAASTDCAHAYSELPCDVGSSTMCSEAQSKHRRRGSSSGSNGCKSQLISLDAAPSQKKRRTSIGGSAVGVDGGGAVAEVVPTTCLVENNTYYDTYDEPLNEALCALETRVAITDRLMTSWSQAPVLLGESPPPEGRTGQTEKAMRRGKSVTVSRTQLWLGNEWPIQQKQEGQQQQQMPPRNNGGTTTPKPAGDESQIVYYRH